MRDSMVIYEYEQVLTGKKNNFRLTFESENVRERCRRGGIVWRYSIEHILHWDFSTAYCYITKDIVKALKLDKTIPFMGLPCNNDIGFDQYLAAAFPDCPIPNLPDPFFDPEIDLPFPSASETGCSV